MLLYARQWCVYPEDALQEAFLEFVRQSELPAEPVAWLYRAIKYRAINLSRAETRRKRNEEQATSDVAPWFVSDPAAELEAAEVEHALRALPMLEREIVIARIWSGLTFTQIAKLVELSSSSVHRRYESALAMLHHHLEGHPQPSPCDDE